MSCRSMARGCIGIATTCLTETIGDDVPMILKEFRAEFTDLNRSVLVHAATPSLPERTWRVGTRRYGPLLNNW